MSHHGDMLETKIAFIAEVVGCLDFTNEHNIFNTNPKATVGIVSGLCQSMSTVQ